MIQWHQQPALIYNRVIRLSPFRKLGLGQLSQCATGFKSSKRQIINRAESIQNSKLASVLAGDADAPIAPGIFKLNQVHSHRIQELGSRIQEEFTPLRAHCTNNRALLAPRS